MDWIEQWFGLNPDGGDGSIEMLVIVAVVALALAVAGLAVPAVRRRLARAFSRRSSARAE